jgi:hypothetical protein
VKFLSGRWQSIRCIKKGNKVIYSESISCAYDILDLHMHILNLEEKMILWIFCGLI